MSNRTGFCPDLFINGGIMFSIFYVMPESNPSTAFILRTDVYGLEEAGEVWNKLSTLFKMISAKP
jgi:hypothetical protein